MIFFKRYRNFTTEGFPFPVEVASNGNLPIALNTEGLPLTH